MKTLSNTTLMVSLTAALGAPLALLAAEKATPAKPLYDQVEARMPMMAAQMDDMQALMKDFAAGCPMGGGQGHMGTQGQQGMPMSSGMHGSQGRQGPCLPG